jgi:GT2 family glycosyltransferase
VVVAWRECDITIEALRSLAHMQPAPDALVCVVQQFTEAELAQLESQAPPGTSVIALDDNVGFCSAANLGMRHAVDDAADWVLLLNNDARVSRDCLAVCLDEATSQERVAIVGPAISFTDLPQQLWYAGGRHSHRFAFTQHHGLRRAASSPPPSSDTDYIPGCCAMFSAVAWRDVGPFRDDFFMYYEDAEWGARARAAGWRLRYVGSVLCEHAVGVSSQQRGSLGLSENTAYYLARNPLRYALDTPSAALRASRVMGLMVVWNAYNAWRVLQSRKLAVGRAYVSGLRDAFAGRMGPRPARRPSC